MNSAFRELVEKDLDVFLNTDEMAEEHTVDGKAVICALEDATISGADGWRALSESTVRLYAKTEDLPERRMRGGTVHIDGVGYDVITWREEMGMTRAELAEKENG